MIDVRDLWKSFNGFGVLKGINLQMAPGTTTVVLGGSGSGKTVLMKHMMGLFKPDRGEAIVDGQNVSVMTRQELAVFRQRMGMVFQNAALFDSMTVGDNVAFPLREHTRLSEQEIKAKVKEKLAVVDLFDVESKFPAELSGGMRKRVGLARAIIREPKIVLYDEPTTGLDPLTTESVDQMIIGAGVQAAPRSSTRLPLTRKSSAPCGVFSAFTSRMPKLTRASSEVWPPVSKVR